MVLIDYHIGMIFYLGNNMFSLVLILVYAKGHFLADPLASENSGFRASKGQTSNMVGTGWAQSGHRAKKASRKNG